MGEKCLYPPVSPQEALDFFARELVFQSGLHPPLAVAWHVMPKAMGAIGTEMHRAASRFAVAAKDAELEGGLNKAFGALSEVMQQCVACHNGYRVH